MENLLVLTHVDETGSALTKASLEAVTAGRELATRLGASLTIGIVAADATSAAAVLASTAALRQRCRCLRGPLPRRCSHHRACSGEFALYPRCRRRGPSPGRIH